MQLRWVVWALGLCWLGAPAAWSGEADAALLTSQDAATGELAGWRMFAEDPQAKPGDVWRLDAQGVLTCRGKPKGYIVTTKDYTDFTLTLEWRWPAGKPGKGGVLLRMTGPDRIWPRSLEAQINAPQAGDFWGLGGYALTGPAERMQRLEHPQFGALVNLKKTAAAEKPAGQWNRYEIIARQGVVRLVVNSQAVNATTACDTTPGKICLTAEGDEYQFRNVRLTVDGK